MKRLILLLTTFILLAISCPSQDSSFTDDHRFVGLDQEIESLLKEYNAVGLSIAIIENNDIVLTKAYGYRDLDNRLPVTTNTIFGIGSLGKSFTAALLGILESEKKVDFNTPIVEYINGLEFYNSEMNKAITIKTLLTHSTGLSGYLLDGSSVLFQPVEKVDFIPRLKYFKPTSKVGQSYNYNNGGYSLAGIIIEKMTGLDWEENIRKRIFEPLEMVSAFTSVPDLVEQEDFSYGYILKENQPTKTVFGDLHFRKPAGGIFCSVIDLTKWLRIWMNHGTYLERQILPSGYVKDAISPQLIIEGGPALKDSDEDFFLNSGYGWGVYMKNGYYKVDHTGGASGFSSKISFLPAEKKGIIVLTNQSNSNLANAIEKLLFKRMLNLSYEKNDLPKPSILNIPDINYNDLKTAINKDQKPTHSLSAFKGEYFHPQFGKFTITTNKGKLLAHFPFTTFILIHDQNNSFNSEFTEDVPVIMGPFLTFNFEVDVNDKISSVLINLDQEPVKFLKE